MITIYTIRPGLFPLGANDLDLCIAPTLRGTLELMVRASWKWHFVSDHEDQGKAEAAAGKLRTRLEAYGAVPA